MSSGVTGRTAIIVTSTPDSPTCEDLDRQAADGLRPRKDYVELAKLLGADVIDRHWMARRARIPSRAVQRSSGMPAAQALEGFLRRNQYDHVLGWADRIGLPLALMLKLTRSRTDLVMISVWASAPKKAFFLQRLHVHTHIRAIVGRETQQEIAATRLGVPREKLIVEPRGVDDAFWRPQSTRQDDLFCAVGWEARDYTTLLRAAQGSHLRLELAIGSVALASAESGTGPVADAVRALGAGGLPPNVTATNRRPRELRDLYARSRFVVVPVHDVEFDAGSTALTEAMSMGRAVIAPLIRGFAGMFEHGTHGLAVKPGDARDLRQAIDYLASNPDVAERMGRAGRALVEERHTLDSSTARLATIVRCGG